MLSITCSSCQKKLAVKVDLAGKKVKCPACGHITAIAAQPAAVRNGGPRDAATDLPTNPPEPADPSATPTLPSSSNREPTQGVKPDAGHDSALTDFLAPPQAGDELGRLGKYRILKILGHGGMGVVFLGEDPKLGRKVAIKAMLPHLAGSKSSQQRFMREAHLAATLVHDHIVPIFQVDEDRGAPYIVMPFLRGEPLDDPPPANSETAPGEPSPVRGRVERQAAPQPGPSRGSARRVLIVAVFAVLALLGAGSIYYWQTNNGTVRIEITDPDIKVAFDKNGPIITGVDKQDIKLTPDEFGLHVERGDLKFDTDKFILKRGETITLKIEWFREGKLQVVQGDKVIGAKALPKAVAVVPPGVGDKGNKVIGAKETPKVEVAAAPPIAPPPALDPAWLKQVAAMPADKQVEEVQAKLKERNPGLDPFVRPKIEHDVVTELRFVTDNVTEISPVRALQGLKILRCRGRKVGQGKLFDLMPLKGMNLVELHCSWNNISDLTPVKDMKLTGLSFRHTKVSDLSPLKGMKLDTLDCSDTKVFDLSPLRDMELTYLTCWSTRVFDLSPLKTTRLTRLSCAGCAISDLSPLKDAKLSYLYFGNNRVSDLTPLKGMKLTTLSRDITPVSDLSPLKDMKLTYFNCEKAKVTDLSALKGMPLKTLKCDFNAERDAAILRSIPTLETINGKDAKDFWKEVDKK